jgi:protein phosphatase
MPQVEVATRSEPGPDGSNQDAFYAQRIDDGFILGVADGMGGPMGGQISSATAISVMEELMEEEFEDVREWVTFTFGETNERIFNHARLNPRYTGMGTTLTVAVLWEDRLHVGHAGDCRLYRYRAGMMQQLTTDHTVLAPWKPSGMGAGSRPAEEGVMSRMLTRSVGTANDVYPDYFSADVSKGDILLLCTDGLHKLLTDEEIRRTLEDRDPEKAADRLMELAGKRGPMDDHTVVVAVISGEK